MSTSSYHYKDSYYPTKHTLNSTFNSTKMSSNSLQPSKLLQTYLTEDEANEMLRKYDQNGDGVLSKDELTGIILRLAGRPSQAANNNDSSTRKAPKVDAKKKPGAVTAKAPARVLDRKASNINLQLKREQMKEIFREHDIDGDGQLSVSELTKAFGFLGSFLPFYKAHYGLKHADTDGDGFISEAELDKLIDYAEKINKKK